MRRNFKNYKWGGVSKYILEGDTMYRIRKLTPKECWRLMDFTDEDFNKAEKVNSNTQLYKQAGNSIVVNVLVAIMGQLFESKEQVYVSSREKRKQNNNIQKQ